LALLPERVVVELVDYNTLTDDLAKGPSLGRGHGNRGIEGGKKRVRKSFLREIRVRGARLIAIRVVRGQYIGGG